MTFRINEKFLFTPSQRLGEYHRIRAFAPRSVWWPSMNSFHYDKWSKIITNEISALYKNKITLTSDNIENKNPKLWKGAKLVFRNWQEAVAAAKLTDSNGNIITGNTNLKVTNFALRANIIEDIKKYHGMGKNVPKEVSERARDCFFGGLTEAREEAGIADNKKDKP